MADAKGEEARLRGDVDNVLRTASGRALFRYLFKICGYSKSSIVVNPRTFEVNERAVVYNESRRSVYVQLRQAATKELLTPVEEAAEAEQATANQKPQKKEEGK